MVTLEARIIATDQARTKESIAKMMLAKHQRTDLSLIPIERFREIETILRTRYMKVLTFKTPQEAWDGEMEKEKKCAERKRERARMTILSASIIKSVGVRLEGVG